MVPTGSISPGGGGTQPYSPTAPTTAEEAGSAEDAERLTAADKHAYWLAQVRAGFKHEDRWRREGREAERLVWGSETTPFFEDEAAKKQTNIIYSNIETLRPMIYSQPPEPIVRRRFMGDGTEDPVGRVAAEVAQRLAQTFIDTTRVDQTLETARDHWLIPGRASSRVFYRAHIETVTERHIDPATGVEVEAAVPQKTHEEVICKAWPWPRMVLSPSASWEDVPWIAWETPMTRAEVAKAFGDEVAGRLDYPISGLTHRDDTTAMSDEKMWAPTDKAQSDDKKPSAHDQTIIFEIWCKTDRTVRWLSPTYAEGLLDEQPDPLGLEEFYDCPEPLFASRRSGTLDVRPDVAYYAARCAEIDDMQRKLRRIIKAISVAGAYPGEKKEELERMLDGEGRLVSVADWQTFAMEGGINNLIQWLPLEQFITAAAALQQMIENAKQMIFEISGISDLVRGQGDPSETATAQKIKGRYAGLRLQSRQRAMGEYARALLRLMVEVAVEHFDTETIADMCNYDLPLTEADRQANAALIQARAEQEQMAAQHAQLAQQGAEVPPFQPAPLPEPQWDADDPSWEAVHDMLRNDLTRKFMIQIETESTIISDEEGDRQARIEFIAGFAGFVETLMPLVTAGAIEARVVKEILLFGVRGFRNARTLEGLIASLPDESESQPAEDASVTVAKIKAEVDREIAQMDNQTRLEVERIKSELEARKAAAEAIMKGAEVDQRAQQGAEDRVSRERQSAAKPAAGATA